MDEKFDDGVEEGRKAWDGNKRIDQRSILHDRSTLRVGSYVKLRGIFGVRVVQENPISCYESGVSRNYSPGFIFYTIKKYTCSTLA